jgi:hypothetical protein
MEEKIAKKFEPALKKFYNYGPLAALAYKRFIFIRFVRYKCPINYAFNDEKSSLHTLTILALLSSKYKKIISL